jgi:hypothetical protein
MFVYAFVKPIVCMRLNNKIIIIIYLNKNLDEKQLFHLL